MDESNWCQVIAVWGGWNPFATPKFTQKNILTIGMRNYSSVSLLTGHELRYKNTRGNSAGIHRTWGFLRREGVAWWYWEKFSADFAPLEVDCWRIHPRWFAKGPFLWVSWMDQHTHSTSSFLKRKCLSWILQNSSSLKMSAVWFKNSQTLWSAYQVRHRDPEKFPNHCGTPVNFPAFMPLDAHASHAHVCRFWSMLNSTLIGAQQLEGGFIFEQIHSKKLVKTSRTTKTLLNHWD